MNQEVNEINNSQSNPILDIVNELQSKLNESNANSNDINNNTNNNAINNKDLSGLDLSKMLETLKNTNNNSNNINNSNTNNGLGLNLDLNSIMNFQKAITSINQTDPRQELLTSLKPFLRETRKKNIDNYITLLGVMKAINLFTNKDRD